MQLRTLVAMLLGISLFRPAGADVVVRDTGLARHERSGLTVAVGELVLPSQGFWRVVEQSVEGTSLAQIELAPPLTPAPASDAEPGARAVLPPEVTYRVYALSAGRGDVRLQLENNETKERLWCAWSHADTTAAPPESVTRWAQMRAWRWAALARDADAPILKAWVPTQERLFGVRTDLEPRDRRRGRREADRDTTLFGVLGGQAAMRETLQLQALQMGAGAADDAPGVPVVEIPGVEIKSHPYEEMLGTQPGGRVPIADVVPVDRFFLHAAKPAAVLPLLNDGAGFIARVGATATGRALDHQVVERYLGKFGMNRPWIEAALRSGAISELALFMPDLFVVDGTEVTLVCRIPNMAVFRPLLAAVGVGNLSAGRPVGLPAASGATSYWALTGDLLLVGTRESELAAALALSANPQGSLGRSAEFRYMLTQLPLRPETRLYAYISDAFIRRLVGPEVKLGQLRRVVEKARMHTATAAALLYTLDSHGDNPSIAELQSKGYLPETADFSSITLDQRLVARSKTHGPLAGLASVSAVPVALATASEARAYRTYLENYNRFWQRFFDPIALRLDDTQDGALELTTFILPLLDNSIYDRFKEFLATERSGAPLRIPRLAPQPVAMLSFRLSDECWNHFVADAQGSRHRRPPDGSVQQALSTLGPNLHLAIHDSNPIIAFGSGELLGMGGSLGGARSEMAFIALLITTLTRPCTLLVELHREDDMKGFLRSGGLARLFSESDDWVQVSHYKLAGEEAWIYGFVFPDLSLDLRLKFEVRNQHLLIHNLPWGPKVAIDAAGAAEMDGMELVLNPAAATQQLAAMFTAAAERERAAAMEGIAYLHPLVLAGGTVEAAIARHRELLGFAPVHPAGGEWRIEDGRLVSSLYGRPGSEQQPAYVQGETRFGVLRGVSELRIGMQFEKTGLRARARWRFAR